MSSDRIRNLYERIAERYDEFIGSRQSLQLEVVRAQTTHRIVPPVLEVGAGTGLLDPHLHMEVIAIDLSRRILARAKGVRLMGDWSGLPFRNDSFNTFFSISVLETDRNSLLKLEDMLRVLTPRGWVFVTVLKTRLLKRVESELGAIQVLGLKGLDAADAILFVGRKNARIN